VQEAMAANLTKNKDEWLTPEFFAKLAQNPKLLKAFQDPTAMAAMSEFGQNPKEAMQKYGNNPEFRELMIEFSKLMGGHFEELADKKAEEAKKEEQE
jgi:arsenate reductase-like glutaredoxin family protein